MLRAQIQQRIENAIHLCVVKILTGVFPSGQNGRLGQIRHEHIRAGHQRAHRLAQFRGVRGVGLAAVAHHRIDQTKRLRVFVVQLLDDRDLLGRPKKTGIHAVKLHILLAPGIQIAIQNLGRIVERVHGIARMRREQRRRHRARIAAGRRQNRNRRRQ